MFRNKYQVQIRLLFQLDMITLLLLKQMVLYGAGAGMQPENWGLEQMQMQIRQQG